MEKYYKVCLFLVDYSIWNSYVINKESKEEEDPEDYLMYGKSAVEKRTGKHKLQFKSLGARHRSHSSFQHFPEHIPPTKKKTAPTRQCYVCCRKRDENGKKIRKETRTYCKDCNVGLCAVSCFKIYHNTDI